MSCKATTTVVAVELNGVDVASHHSSGEQRGKEIREPSPVYSRNESTDSQLAIIQYPASSNELLSIQAGPGSGKTWTLVKRVAYLIEKEDILPEEILILSMTNRAVNTLRDTLGELLGTDGAKQIDVSTFHSFCANLVDQYDSIYFPQNPKRRIMDDLSWRNFSNIFSGKTIGINGKTLNGKVTAYVLEGILNEIKRGEIDIKGAAQKHKVSSEYLEELLQFLEKNGIMRYQDFLTDALAILKKSTSDTELIHRVHNYKVVIVDEFQDMHHSLLSIVKEVIQYPTSGMETTARKHLTIAGDKHQCIYEFLGSKPAIDLKTEFPEFRVTNKTIQESFRLTPEILAASREVALSSNNLLESSDLDLVSTRVPIHKPIIYDIPTRFSEYQFIIEEIARLILESGGLLKPSDILVLGRANKDVEEFQLFAKNHGFQTNRFSSTVPWIKSKVHTLLDILNVIDRGAGSDFNLLCVILLLDKKIGSRLRVSKVFNLFNNWKVNNFSGLYEDNKMEEFLLKEVQLIDEKRSKKEKSLATIYRASDHRDTIRLLKKFLGVVSSERQRLSLKQTPRDVLESLLKIVSNSGLIKHINSATPLLHGSASLQEEMSEYSKKLEGDVTSFFESLCHTHKMYVNEGSNDSFIEYFLRTYNNDIPVVNDAMINVSTIHTAKGLEFPVVFVLGNSSTNKKYWSSCIDKNTIADSETARLLYVACTRASTLLYVGSQVPSDRFATSLPAIQPLVPALADALGRRPPTSTRIETGSKIHTGLFSTPLITSNAGGQGSHRLMPKRSIALRRAPPLVTLPWRKICHFLSRV